MKSIKNVKKGIAKQHATLLGVSNLQVEIIPKSVEACPNERVGKTNIDVLSIGGPLDELWSVLKGTGGDRCDHSLQYLSFSKIAKLSVDEEEKDCEES